MKAVKFPFGAVRFSPPSHLIKKPSAFSWHRSRPAAPVWNTSYIHGRMDGCIFRTCIDMKVICTPGKKSQKRKPKTRENRRADSAVHYALCVPFVGLNSTERYCSRVYSVLHTPYSILVRNTEEGFLAINQSLVPLVVSSMDQTMGHGCVYVQSTVVC